MWSLISRIVLRLAAVRWLFKLGGLGLLIPLAFVLKTVGLPLLLILMVVALPVLALLFLFGLPVILVLVFGSLFTGFVGMALTVGMLAIKFALFFVLPAWLIWRIGSAICKPSCRRDGDGASEKP